MSAQDLHSKDSIHDDRDDLPARWLVDHIELLPRGRALDVAMGYGRNAIYLAQHGFDVEGVDIAPEAINGALEAAERSGVRVRAKVADLEKDYRIRPGAYDVIICFRYLQRSLLPDIKAGLRPGGMVVYETFIVDQTRFGRPHNPDFLLKHNELLHAFRDLRCLRYREGIMDGKEAVASLIAQQEQNG